MVSIKTTERQDWRQQGGVQECVRRDKEDHSLQAGGSDKWMSGLVTAGLTTLNYSDLYYTFPMQIQHVIIQMSP